jgi:hypothetical protein
MKAPLTVCRCPLCRVRLRMCEFRVGNVGYGPMGMGVGTVGGNAAGSFAVIPYEISAGPRVKA